VEQIFAIFKPDASRPGPQIALPAARADGCGMATSCDFEDQKQGWGGAVVPLLAGVGGAPEQIARGPGLKKPGRSMLIDWPAIGRPGNRLAHHSWRGLGPDQRAHRFSGPFEPVVGARGPAPNGIGLSGKATGERSRKIGPGFPRETGLLGGSSRRRPAGSAKAERRRC